MIMSKVKSIIKPELAKFIRESFPVTRKRSALWFFSNEFKNNLNEPNPNYLLRLPQSSEAGPQESDNKGSLAKRPQQRKLGRNRIFQMWKNMDPESKRKYFNMAELDEVRYKEQKSLWVSQVGALLQKNKDFSEVVELAPSHEKLQNDFLESLEKLQKNYEQMIQTESTKEIYKAAIKKAEGKHLGADEIISAVPKHHEALLAKPRRPPAAFVLFLNDNMSRYKRIRRETRTKENCMRLCANEWANLDPETKQIYEDRYLSLKSDYDRALEKYRADIQGTSDTYLSDASREKRAFRRSLRKRLRESSVLPLCIRNAFNFYLMEQKDSKLSDATKTWRSLSPEEKTKYEQMTAEDVKRYHREIETFNRIKESLNEVVAGRKSRR